MPSRGTAKSKSFEAVLEKGDNGLGWTIARVPFVPHDLWPEMLRLRVKGTVNGFAFRTSLFPYLGGGAYYLLVNRAMQRGGRVRLGDKAAFSLQADLAPRPAELPEELDMLLDEEDGLRGFYDSLSESMRREIGKWTGGVKSEASRTKRAQQMAERLLFAMEGEREMPPILTVAFRGRPKAKLGWQRMTQYQRRCELLAVYYYQTPEARERRVQKLVDAAERRAQED
jgi:uncharacterized protein YdeI (YjbR/CyaY-like superfamily)